MKVHKEEQTESKVSRRKEIMKIRAEKGERDTHTHTKKKTIEKSRATKSQLFEKINKINKPLTKLIMEKKGEISSQ